MNLTKLFLPLFVALALTACGDDSSGSSKVDWSNIDEVSWEKLTDGGGTWVLDINSPSFYRSQSAQVFGVEPGDSININRYVRTNTLTMRFVEETEGKITRRYCVLDCVGDQCSDADRDIWREVTGEKPLTVLPSVQATYFINNDLFTFEGAKIDQTWLFLADGRFFSATGSSGEPFWKR